MMASDPDHDAGPPVGHPVHMTPSTATPAPSVAVGAAVTFSGSPGAPTRGTSATRAPTALDELDELEQSDSDDGGGLFYLPQAFASGENDASAPVNDDVPVGTLVSAPAPASPVPPPRTVPSAVPAAPPAVVKPARPAPAQPATDVPVEGSRGGGVPGSAPAPVAKPRRRPAPAAPAPPRRRHSPRPATKGGTPPAGDASVGDQASGGGGSGRGSAPADQRRGSADGSGDAAAQAAPGAVESGVDEEAARAAAAAAAARDAHDMNIAVNHMGETLFQEMLEPAKKLDALQARLQDVVTGNTPEARARKEARRKAKEARRAERATRRAERATWRAERRMARATGRPLPPRPPKREGSFRSLESDDDDWNDDAGEHTDGSDDSAEEVGHSMAHDATRIRTAADGVDSAYADDADGDAVSAGDAVPLAISGAAVSYV